MKIAFFDTKSYDSSAFSRCSENTGIEYTFFETRLSPKTASLAAGFDGVCVFVNDTVDATVIDTLYRGGVRFIALRCAGYNNVDIGHAFGKIHVFHVPAYSPHAVAEHAMALLLTSVRRTHKAYARTKEFNFSLQDLVGFDLHGKTVGIIGTGKIGRVFADICLGFGMRVLGYDKYPAPNSPVAYTDLDTLFRESDVVSLHCPLTDETHHLICRERIETMKKGVVIVNTSRGALIDASALLWGIKERIVGAACLDVYEEETEYFFEDRSSHILEDDTLARLISMPNVILTSHQGFLTREALDAIAETTTRNLLSYEKEGFCENELCYRCGKTEICKGKNRGKCF
ncbi:MAG: 2-hydroxyacid dehydrogenase [Clostridia bacterium]|nr:2-hydroxyacid dehydrogenase [Clostridia bacterium]